MAKESGSSAIKTGSSAKSESSAKDSGSSAIKNESSASKSGISAKDRDSSAKDSGSSAKESGISAKDSGYSTKNTGYSNKKNISNKKSKNARGLGQDIKGEDEYDLVVIGGGSGGLGVGRASAKLGKKVIILQYMEPSPARGVSGGFGGTCVNVGCIPKKLYHHAAQLATSLRCDAEVLGLNNSSCAPLNMDRDWKVDWKKVASNITNHIHSVNALYKDALEEEGVNYLFAKGSFESDKTVIGTLKDGKTYKCHGKYIVIAVGGRPIYPDVPGAKECGITSDDLFSLDYPPGKTLVVGGGYVGVETAGFLSELGFEVEVLIRDRILKAFDIESVDMVREYMEKHCHIKFHDNVEVVKLEMVNKGKPPLIRVTMKGSKSGGTFQDTFNTVLFAIGRRPSTDDLNLEKAGVDYDKKSGYITLDKEETNVPHIFAIGDVIRKVPHLTPVAVRAGHFLAERLFVNSQARMNYEFVPSAVFTPLEYSFVGFSEEEAIEKFGADAIEAYHARFTPVEWWIQARKGQRAEFACYAKIVCRKDSNQETIVGIHFVGPGGSDIVQLGTPLVTLGASRDLLLIETVGVHPSCSELFTKLRVTRSSGKDNRARDYAD